MEDCCVRKLGRDLYGPGRVFKELAQQPRRPSFPKVDTLTVSTRGEGSLRVHSGEIEMRIAIVAVAAAALGIGCACADDNANKQLQGETLKPSLARLSA